MESFPGDLELKEGLPQLIVIAIVGLASVYIFARLFTDPEAAVDYTIPEPEQLHPDWKGEVLDEPSSKVYPLASTTQNSANFFPDLRLECHTMLRSSYRSIARPRQPVNPRWHRSSH